jgi:multidrug transporter EmrE-like cation transporter
MYFRYTAIAFLANGFGVFGLRLLAGMRVENPNVIQYLTLWYLFGAGVGLIPYLVCCRRPFRREIWFGLSMAVASLGGQLGMERALSTGLPGYIVFPTAMGGGMLLVTVVGVSIFRERVGRAGYLGIVAGTLSVILLALP